MPILHNIGRLTSCTLSGGAIDLERAVLVWEGAKIVWVGGEDTLPAEYHDRERIDAKGGLVLPGLIDCHTHLLFAGWRAEEFERKIAGESYLDILRSGGGILQTVRQTRAASDELLLTRARTVLRTMATLGVTTIEAKSGYGLSFHDELRLLSLYEELKDEELVRIVTTCLAAHALPPEFKDDHQGYVDCICNELLPEIRARGLSTRFVDIFLEEGAFNAHHLTQIAHAAKKLGFDLKVHADQLSDQGGAAAGAALGAVSVDHLEKISPTSIAKLAQSGTVAVLLPLATLYLGKTPAPASALRAAGVPIALATDFNPGSAPSYHLPLAMMLGCTLLRLPPLEVLRAATINAARALRLEQEAGSLETGKSADFCVLDAPDLRTWLYHFESNACVRTVYRGQTIYTRQ